MQQGILDVDTLHCISPPPGWRAAAQKPTADNTGNGWSVLGSAGAFESALRSWDAGSILHPPLVGGGRAAPWHEVQLEAAVQKPSQNYASDGLFGPDQVKAFESACMGGGFAAPWPKAQFVDGPGDPWASLENWPLPAKVALAPLLEEGEGPGMPTTGAVGHNLGLCRPCNFTTKAGGCRQGEACRFCHICGPSLVRKRKREKKRLTKGLLRCSDEPECTMVLPDKGTKAECGAP